MRTHEQSRQPTRDGTRKHARKHARKQTQKHARKGTGKWARTWLAAVSVTGCLLVAGLPGMARAAITLTLVEDPALGIFFSGAGSRQFILQTNGTIGGTHAADHVSGSIAGRFTVADDSSPASIVILVDNIFATGGLSVTRALCSYDGGADGTCDGGGMTETSVSSATLKVGLDVSTTQAHGGGDTASVSMDVSVTYL